MRRHRVVDSSDSSEDFDFTEPPTKRPSASPPQFRRLQRAGEAQGSVRREPAGAGPGSPGAVAAAAPSPSARSLRRLRLSESEELGQHDGTARTSFRRLRRHGAEACQVDPAELEDSDGANVGLPLPQQRVLGSDDDDKEAAPGAARAGSPQAISDAYFQCSSDASPQHRSNGAGGGSGSSSRGARSSGGERDSPSSGEHDSFIVSDSSEEAEEEESRGGVLDGQAPAAGGAGHSVLLSKLGGLLRREGRCEEGRIRQYLLLRLCWVLGLPEALQLPEARQAAASVERQLLQHRDDCNNLVGWRRAEPGLLPAFLHCPVVCFEGEEPKRRWAVDCTICRVDRQEKVLMVQASFRGQPGHTTWLSLESQLPPASPPPGGDPAGARGDGGGGSGVGEADMLLPGSYLMYGPEADEDEEEGDGDEGDRDGESTSASSGGSEGGSDGSGQSGGSSRGRLLAAAEEAQQRSFRIGWDCFARAYCQASLHQYPRRLDRMLLLKLRRYLRDTPQAAWPGDAVELAAAVHAACAHQLQAHLADFLYTVNGFHMRQGFSTRNSPGTVATLQSKLYARVAQPSGGEQLGDADAASCPEVQQWCRWCQGQQHQHQQQQGQEQPATLLQQRQQEQEEQQPQQRQREQQERPATLQQEQQLPQAQREEQKQQQEQPAELQQQQQQQVQQRQAPPPTCMACGATGHAAADCPAW